MAQSKWLESKRLDLSEIRALCERVSDVRMLARMQITIGWQTNGGGDCCGKNWLLKSQVWACPRSIPAAATGLRALAQTIKGAARFRGPRLR